MTPTQTRVLELVRVRLDIAREAPTIEELARDVGYKSKGAIHRVLDALIEQGKLVRTTAKTRNLALPEHVDLIGVSNAQLLDELKRRGALDRPQRPRLQGSTECPVMGCAERITPGKLLCRDHWFRLDEALRRQLLGERLAAVRARKVGDRLHERLHSAAYAEAWNDAIVQLETRVDG